MADWKHAWASPGERLIVQSRQEEGWVRHRFLSNSEGDGAVAVVVDGSCVLLIHADRPVTGRQLWEFPRGQADEGDTSPEATAQRELLEETGMTALETLHLGQIWPESGLCADAVNVVLVRVDAQAPAAPAEYEQLRWVEFSDLGVEIAEDRVRDGITISALALAWAKGALQG